MISHVEQYREIEDKCNVDWTIEKWASSFGVDYGATAVLVAENRGINGTKKARPPEKVTGCRCHKGPGLPS